MSGNPLSNVVWEDKLTWFKSSSQYRTLDAIDGEPMEFEWNIFPGFTTLQLCNKVQEFMSKMSDQPQEFKGRIIFMSMFNDISWGSEDNEQECESNANLVSIYARRFSPWSFLGSGSEKKWHSTHDSRPQGEWDRVAELMMIKFGESGHPVSVSRVHCPEERSKAKEVENYQYTSALMGERLKLFFAQLFLFRHSPSVSSSLMDMRPPSFTAWLMDSWPRRSTHSNSFDSSHSTPVSHEAFPNPS